MLNLLGLTAGICTSLAFFPQAKLVWREGKKSNISLVTYVILLLGVSLWFTYGLLAPAPPIVITNSVTIILASSIIYAKLRKQPKC